MQVHIFLGHQSLRTKASERHLSIKYCDIQQGQLAIGREKNEKRNWLWKYGTEMRPKARAYKPPAIVRAVLAFVNIPGPAISVDMIKVKVEPRSRAALFSVTGHMATRFGYDL